MGGFSQYDLKSILNHVPYFVYKIYAAILMNYYLVCKLPVKRALFFLHK